MRIQALALAFLLARFIVAPLIATPLAAPHWTCQGSVKNCKTKKDPGVPYQCPWIVATDETRDLALAQAFDRCVTDLEHDNPPLAPFTCQDPSGLTCTYYAEIKPE